MKYLTSIIFSLLFLFSKAQNINLEIDSAQIRFGQEIFKEVKKICDNDNGKLWGKNLYTPVLIINQYSNFIVANEPDSLGKLTKFENIYIGTLPKDKIFGNSTIEYSDKLWATIVYNPNFIDNDVLQEVLLHEMFHYYQIKNNLKPYNYINSHIENKEARILLKLEWEALEQAVKSTDNKRITAITDALIFKKYRRMLYPQADTMENIFEMHEGLPNYTAYALKYKEDSLYIEKILLQKELFYNVISYTRWFAYTSGLFYGFLLDKSNVEWKKDLKYNSDLALILQKAYNITLPDDIKNEVIIARKRYNCKEIDKFENVREKKSLKEKKIYTQKLTIKPIVNFPSLNTNYLMDPSSIITLDTLGILMPQTKIIDDWGELNVVDGGCLLKKGHYVKVTAKNIKISENSITGEGWNLVLKENWTIVKENKNYIIKKRWLFDKISE